MKNPNVTLTGTPPKLFPTLLKGFNTIANHWYMILFPMVLDVLLWLGPKLKIKSLMSPFISSVMDSMLKFGPQEAAETWAAYQTMWSELLDQFNLANALRTIPVGIPSIIARLSPTTSPLSVEPVYEIPSVNLVFAILLGLLLIGFFLGSLYFLLISHLTADEATRIEASELFSSFVQSMVMFCLIVLLLLFIMLPVTMVLSLVSMVNFGIGQFLVLMAVFVMIWLLMPLVFSPHGIFVLKQKALPSMLLSVRLVRLFLPGTGLFLFISILISEGLNYYVWTLPEASSWMTLLSIGGHAFVVTGLLTASFIYYREGLKWMQGNLQKMAEASNSQQQNGGTTLEQ